MNNDSTPRDPSASDLAMSAVLGGGSPCDVDADGFADIGYEAADPSLQAPLWLEAMQAGASPRAGR